MQTGSHVQQARERVQKYVDALVRAQRSHPQQLTRITSSRIGRRKRSIRDRVRQDPDPGHGNIEARGHPNGKRRADRE